MGHQVNMEIKLTNQNAMYKSQFYPRDNNLSQQLTGTRSGQFLGNIFKMFENEPDIKDINFIKPTRCESVENKMPTSIFKKNE